MANMSYVRFENTPRDLEDCLEALREGEELSESEVRWCERLIKTCRDILDEAEGIERYRKLCEGR